MASNNILRWQDGQGWLVLSGGNDSSSEVRARTLERAAADGGVVYLSLDGTTNSVEAAMEDFEDLGAGAGYLVDVLTEDDDTIKLNVSEASIVVIQGGQTAAQVRSNLLGAAVEGIRTAYERGAMILAEGICASVFGAWIIGEDGALLDGLGWLQRGLVVAGVTAVSSSPDAIALLNEQPDAIALGIGIGSGLALGPAGEVEPWGKRQVTIALGSVYRN